MIPVSPQIHTLTVTADTYWHVEFFCFSAGRSHPAMLSVCDCEPFAATYIRYGLWPTRATRPSVGVSLELLTFMHILTLECAVSVKGFINTIRWIHKLTTKEVMQTIMHLKVLFK